METLTSWFLGVTLALSSFFGGQPEPTFGLATLKPVQGGTGLSTAAPSDVGKVLKVSDDSPFTFTLQDDNTGAGGSFPFTPTSYGNSTTSVLGLLGGVFSNASSTFHILKAGTASTTNLIVSNLNAANCDLKSDSTGNITCGTDATGGGGGGSGNVATSSAETSGRVPFWTTTSGTPAQLSGGVAGFAWNDTFKRLTATYGSSTVFSATTFYGALVGNADTATALAADPANCSAGNAPLGIVASGAVEGCFDVWTEAENTAAGYVVGTRALTVAGTANQITSSAGSQNLTADRTWTLSLPSHVIFPGSYVASNGTTTNATSTNFGGSFFTAIGSSGLDFHSSNGTSVLQLGAGAGSNASFFGGVNIDGTTRLATSLTGILKATAGTVSVATAGTDYANFAYPFTPATSWFSTSTISLNTAGIMSTASSTLHLLRSGYATLTYSSTTYATADTASTTSFFGAMLRNCNSNNVLTWTNGTFGCEADDTGGAGSSPAGANTNIQYNDAGSFGGDNNFTWDKTNLRLGIGTTTPISSLGIVGTTTASGSLSVLNSPLFAYDYLFRVENPFQKYLTESGSFCGFGFVPGKDSLLGGCDYTGSNWTTSNIGANSFSWGEDNIVSSVETYALGAGNVVTGSYSLGFGDRNTVAGQAVLVSGQQNNIKTNGGLSAVFGYLNVLGSSTVAYGSGYSFIAGNQNTVVGPYSWAIGNNNSVEEVTNVTTADASFAMGDGNTVQLLNSGALGWFNTVTDYANRGGNDNIVIGAKNILSGDGSYIFGRNGSSTCDKCITFSAGPLGVSPPKLTNNINNSIMFGVNSTLPSLTITGANGSGTTGYVGIGTTSPIRGLTIASSTGPQLMLSDGLSSGAPWDFRSINGNLHISTSSISNFATSSISALWIDTTGTVNFGNKLATCIALTGSAGLCDGGDATGGGGSTDSVLWANASTSLWAPLSILTISSSSIAFLDSVRATSTSFISTQSTSTNDYIGTHLYVAGTTRINVNGAVLSTTAGGVIQSTTVSSPLSFSGSTLSCATCATFSWPWTPATSWNATSTLMLNTGGFMSIASSTFTNLVSNYLSIASDGSLTLPTTASPVVNVAGEIALDTTSGNIIFATSTAQSLVLGGATTTLYSFVIASTSPDFVSGGIIPLPTHFLKQQAVGIICKVDAGTSQQIFLSDSGSTNDTNSITCSTTETQYNLTTNNIWTAYEPIQLEFGTKSGSPDYITIRIVGFRTSD